MSSDDLIVLDEPITNLDAKLRDQMLHEIRQLQLNLGTTIFYITHDQRAALQLGDKLAIMNERGELVQIGSDEDIILRPESRFIFEFIGVTNFIPLKRADSEYKLDVGRELIPGRSRFRRIWPMNSIWTWVLARTISPLTIHRRSGPRSSGQSS